MIKMVIRNIKKLFELLDEHSDKIKLVFSSIAFEVWVLLHFEKCSNPFPKSIDIIDEKFVGGPRHIPLYEKKGAFDLYPLIQQNTRNALINAAWLRYVQYGNLSSLPIYKINPITDVDVLVKRLMDINENFYFVGLGRPLTIDNIEFNIIKFQEEKKINLINSKRVAFTTNELFFYSKQSGEIAIPISSTIIIPQNNLSLQFSNHSELYVKFGFNTIFFI